MHPEKNAPFRTHPGFEEVQNFFVQHLFSLFVATLAVESPSSGPSSTLEIPTHLPPLKPSHPRGPPPEGSEFVMSARWSSSVPTHSSKPSESDATGNRGGRPLRKPRGATESGDRLGAGLPRKRGGPNDRRRMKKEEHSKDRTPEWGRK